jgi:hypothetical protein
LEAKDFMEFSDFIESHVTGAENKYKAKERETEYKKFIHKHTERLPKDKIVEKAKLHSRNAFNVEISELFKNFKRGEGDLKKAIAIHFTLHIEPNWKSRAKQLDKALFRKNVDASDLFRRPSGDAVEAYSGDGELQAASADTAWPHLELPATPDTDDAETWLNPLNHVAIPLFGREGELKTLSSFLESSDKFSILAIIGPSGAGKTRLVAEWLLKHVDLRRWSGAF